MREIAQHSRRRKASTANSANSPTQAFLAQQRMTDEEVREIIGDGLLQQSADRARGRATHGRRSAWRLPYASMLLEAREGDVACSPAAKPSAPGLTPRSCSDPGLLRGQSRRYMVPEQRVLADRQDRPGAGRQTSAATDKEIAAYYNANRGDNMRAKDTRTISQAVAPDQATANAIASAAQGRSDLAAAAAPPASPPQDIDLGAQTREQFHRSVAGRRALPAQLSVRATGAVVGPLQSDFGWHVVRIDKSQREGGKLVRRRRAPKSPPSLTSRSARTRSRPCVEQGPGRDRRGRNLRRSGGCRQADRVTTPPVSWQTARRVPTPAIASAGAGPGAAGPASSLRDNDQPRDRDLARRSRLCACRASDGSLQRHRHRLASIRDRVARDWIADQASQRAAAACSDDRGKGRDGLRWPRRLKQDSPCPVAPSRSMRAASS